MLRKMLAAGSLLAALSVYALAQQPRGKASPRTTSTDTGDFTEGNLKFHRVAMNFLQVTDTEKNQAAGTVILQQGGAPMFAPMPGYDIKSAYEKHMNGGAAAAAAAAPGAAKEESPTTAGTPAPAPTAAATFDAASKTASLSGGRSVTFVDGDNLKVEIPGAAGAQTYDLHYHKTSGGQFAQVLARGEMGHTGMGSGMKGPFSGGVTITLEGANGMPGGKLYDTLEGGNMASGPAVSTRIKPILDAVREAVDLAKPTQPKLADEKVVKTLLDNNLVR